MAGLIITLNNITPHLGTDCFIADNAVIVGDVKCGNQCSFWFNVVVRGDVHYIKMGNKVNVQDGAIIHCTYKKAPVNIGDSVSIGHRAMLHGCTIQDNVLIGMGAIVMDGAVIEKNSIVAAGAVVLENTIVKSGSIFGGVPAKFMKMGSQELIEGEINRIASNYVLYASWYKK
jgi:carbonic anhydrase/acetyltransferase-like protein (isoleucine patch superfamily)